MTISSVKEMRYVKLDLQFMSFEDIWILIICWAYDNA